jgi:hypothetical protein
MNESEGESEEEEEAAAIVASAIASSRCIDAAEAVLSGWVVENWGAGQQDEQVAPGLTTILHSPPFILLRNSDRSSAYQSSCAGICIPRL